MTQTLVVTAAVWRDKELWIASCRQFNLVTQAKSLQEISWAFVETLQAHVVEDQRTADFWELTPPDDIPDTVLLLTFQITVTDEVVKKIQQAIRTTVEALRSRLQLGCVGQDLVPLELDVRTSS